MNQLTRDQLEPDQITLSEDENRKMDLVLKRVPGRPLETPGKEAMKLLPMKEPQAPPCYEADVEPLAPPMRFDIFERRHQALIHSRMKDDIRL
ncbi:unnamed protein product [Rhizophagus irregularis]|nr:unnamed protein product [Rhizophagus irregularis]